MANERQLPSKEQALFRQIVKYYETKNYKKGLKAAEQILKKFPDHGGEPRTRSGGPPRLARIRHGAPFASVPRALLTPLASFSAFSRRAQRRSR